MKLNIIPILFALFLFTSCEEVIELDAPDNTVKLVIEGQVTTEVDSSFVRLTQSVAYFDNTSTTPFVTNAQVEVNGVVFNHVANGIYKPALGYVGVAGQNYSLKVTHDSKTYVANSFLEPMFQVDTIVSVFKEKEGFIDEGYAVRYIARDDRPRTKFTYFRFGFKSEETFGKDSFNDFRVLFDNRNSIMNQPFMFELPFLRLKANDTALLIFRSIDEPVNRFYLALGNRGNGGGPFTTPPANLPTNITGGALGLFAAYDVKRFRARIFE